MEEPALGPETSVEKAWFEVKLLDVYGKPVDGAEVVFTQGSFKEKTKTNSAGIAKWKDVEGGSFAAVKLAKPTELRESLRDRWGKSKPAEGLEGIKQSIVSDDISASLTSAVPSTLILFQPLTLVRLAGMHFDTNKCFLRPPAMNGIRQVVAIYKANPAGKLLIVGHTDTTADDAYNLDLSVERAEAVKAYLKDDVAAWDAWFADSKPPKKRWGDAEVYGMISALPCEQSAEGFQEWSNSTRGTALTVDGKVGPKTRKALIEAYMALDGTTLPTAVGAEVHGLGEFFPREDTGNDVKEQKNRRVEIFCFGDKIHPPVPGTKGIKGEPEYKQWSGQVTDEYDVETNLRTVHVRLHTGQAKPMTNVEYRTNVDGMWSPRRMSSDGWVALTYSGNPKSAAIEWAYDKEADEYLLHAEVQLGFSGDNEKDWTRARLHNLGYPNDGDASLEEAVKQFQSDFHVAESGMPGGKLPPQTKARLLSLFDEECNATRPSAAA